MAIIDILPGVQVEITVHGSALKEYADPDLEEEDRSVTRYVEAMSGQTFEIVFTVLPNFEFKGDCIGFIVVADGLRVSGRMISKDSEKRQTKSLGYDRNRGELQRFRFASIETGK